MSLSDENCQSCKALQQNLHSAYLGGGHIEGGKWEVTSSEFVRESKRVGAIWNVDVATQRERWFNGDGDQVKTVVAGVQHLGVAIQSTPDGLIVREMRLR